MCGFLFVVVDGVVFLQIFNFRFSTTCFSISTDALMFRCTTAVTVLPCSPRTLDRRQRFGIGATLGQVATLSGIPWFAGEFPDFPRLEP